MYEIQKGFRHSPCYTYARKLIKFKLILVVLIFAILQASASSYAQITLNEKNATLETVLTKIRKQSGYDFFYQTAVMVKAKPVTIVVKNVSVADALALCFKGQPLTYQIEDKTIVVRYAAPTGLTQTVEAQVITGKVLGENDKPLPGVNIRIKDSKTLLAASNEKGEFSITVPNGNETLVFSYVGYQTREIKLQGGAALLIVKMLPEENVMKDVVITGMVNKSKTAFSGATATFTGEELKQVGNQNLIKSLATLDPAFIQIENNSAGSNPNVLPTVELRGQTSIATQQLRDQFLGDPNQPLFILDGFETNLRTIVDLDMNIVASVTILKDAASTALYGSRASNGVVVVETKKPVSGKIRLSYSSDMNIEMPDLSSYNMMNASEKLEYERLAGRYTSTDGYQQAYDTLYNNHLREVLKGVNTYWLSQPLQTGFSLRHSVSASGGDNAIRYSIGANIRQNDATMIGTQRKDWGAFVDLSYRTGAFNISNRTYVNGYNKVDSPYGSFSDWVETNPYLRLQGADQKYIENVRLSHYSGIGKLLMTPNPFYNAGLRSFSKGSSFGVQNNFSMNAEFNRVWKIGLNAQISKSATEDVSFVSPLHTQYENIEDPTLKGRYSNTRNGGLNYTANLSVTYAKVFDKHMVNAFARVEFAQNDLNLKGFSVLGFPNNSNGNPSFAYGFAAGARPTVANSLTRRNSNIASLSYSYDQRYNADFNLNIDGSTAYGASKRYASFYSAGLSWNINREKFMKGIEWINVLRLRGNVGLTGNQNFNNVNQSVYAYYATVNTFGQGVYLQTLGASDLEAQKTLQTSVGIDATLWNNRLRLQFNAYRKLTDPLVVAVSLPSSTALATYPLNTGASTTKGIDGSLFFSPIYKPGKLVWTLGATWEVSRQKFSKFDQKLEALNTTLRNSNSLTRYRDGYSSYDLWAVPSLGIDPATGNEVFLGKDGQQTFVYNTSDQVVVGSSRPKIQGVISSSLLYKGFRAGISIRYILGRSIMNSALYEKVENISAADLLNNQDKRALYDRWKNPGDVAQFKKISSTTTTPMSSRFLQKENAFIGESFNVGYEFKDKKWLQYAYLERLSLNAYSNDLFYASNIRRERGIDYPFARSVSFSLRATFK
ncbi:SusC/RagA family TonB-linked outer membrane protein [Pedobacter sp. KR3-3]|uniref:SusC/RagA family TonB-linked outer membrane protein n=1 Tax=Pedobacter albus TaxID=3113905 RepID=A0ABU7I419_9SPHI|nr:SusC/RagA family TonB-linked outer membrane protein [Pedobacter sp. KR3-3]MEE1944200.1 SusC/RagA family TonB-linked outer membrane protein [Pedobacter sp. KR3-3]